jgi:hypothetical protein
MTGLLTQQPRRATWIRLAGLLGHRLRALRARLRMTCFSLTTADDHFGHVGPGADGGGGREGLDAADHRHARRHVRQVHRLRAASRAWPATAALVISLRNASSQMI